ncbi:hypothetical protein SUGI_0795380 [Cryptomeria japonica]|nr:hypothetical protein SUGI_0795380 [Cryptomeria japonica]
MSGKGGAGRVRVSEPKDSGNGAEDGEANGDGGPCSLWHKLVPLDFAQAYLVQAICSLMALKRAVCLPRPYCFYAMSSPCFLMSTVHCSLEMNLARCLRSRALVFWL